MTNHVVDYPTCASCKFIGTSYWGHISDWGGLTHFCLKSDDRRRDTMKPTGDFAEDFMCNFRAFFDAKAVQCACGYYEERPVVSGEVAELLLSMHNNEGRGAFTFFSRENSIATGLVGIFLEKDDRVQRSPSDGTRDYVLSHVGCAEVERIKAAVNE